MGLIVPQVETPFGILLTDAYVSVSKEGINITGNENTIVIKYFVRTYKDEESRRNGLQALKYEFLDTEVALQDLGNPFSHIYAALKSKYPDSADC